MLVYLSNTRLKNLNQGDNLTQLEVDVCCVMDDIKMFVAETLKLRLTEEENDQWERERLKVIEDLPLISNGQFQWAHLIVSEMNQCFTWREVKHLLREGYMPKSLFEMYTRIIYRLNATLSPINFEKAKCLLRWCACSVRPLRLEEIADLLILRESIGWSAENAESLGPHCGFPEKKTWTLELCTKYEYQVRKICGCLVHFRPSQDERPGTSTLHFVHLSAKEFLATVNREAVRSATQARLYDNAPGQDGAEIPFLVNPQQQNADLFWDCMVYLSQPCFQERIMKIRGDPFDSAKVKNHPFLFYAATSWPLHLRLSENASIESTRSRLQRFFKGPNLRTWMESALALKDGLEWLHLIGLAIREWVNKYCDAQADTSAFENWAVDVVGSSFMVLNSSYPREVLANKA